MADLNSFGLLIVVLAICPVVLLIAIHTRCRQKVPVLLPNNPYEPYDW